MLKQQFSLKLTQKLSPQQIQLMKLIQLPTQAFEERIKQEIEENPALDTGKETTENEYDEFDNNTSEDEYDNDINIDDYLSDDEIPNYRLQANNYSSDDKERTVPYAGGTSFLQYLKSQIDTFSLGETNYQIALFLIGSIDESGYIRRNLEDITDDLAFTQNIFTDVATVENVLSVVQQLDPPGVGARNLQECLSIQIKRRKKTTSTVLATRIIDDAFELFSKKHYEKLISKYGISEENLRDSITEIESLNPKPGGSFPNSNRIIEHIVPDFTIRIIEGNLELSLNNRNTPELHISGTYTNMLQGYKDSKEKTRSQKEAVSFIKQKLDAAKWFIDAIKQRQQTLMLTMNAIMKYQEVYFLSGDERDLKPMILKDIATEIQMDISTVSRVANSKYVDTPYGTKLIKDFFSESMTNDQGEEVSTREIKKIVEITIEEEDKKKPYTDSKLADILKEKGYPIARRTVAKYREQLDIPVARLRKKI